MAVPQALLRLQKSEAYAAWKASDYALSELDEWCDENAERYERTPAKLKAWIADCAANEFSRAKLDSATESQKVGRLVGATVPKALQTLVDGLSAERVKVLVDRNGKRVGEERSADHEARISSAKEILKVMGAYAPEKVELFNGHLDEFTRLTDEELRRQIAAERTKHGKGTGTETVEGVNGASGGEGLSLLPDGSDVDEGRAGRSDALQAISKESPLFSADTRRAQ